MKKKLVSLALALLFSLPFVSTGLSARAQEPDPTPIPVVTVDPRDPEKPGEPQAAPQGLPPVDNDLTPDPKPIERG